MKKTVLLLCAVLLIAIVYNCTADCNTADMQKKIYIVQPNDTLWEIADEYCPKNMDKREYIFNLKKHNGLGDYIQPGEHIEILVEE